MKTYWVVLIVVALVTTSIYLILKTHGTLEGISISDSCPSPHTSPHNQERHPGGVVFSTVGSWHGHGDGGPEAKDALKSTHYINTGERSTDIHARNNSLIASITGSNFY